MSEQIGGYEVIAELTRGISGRVVLAQAPGTTEFVAIKQLLIETESGLSEEEQIARFKRESEIHLSLSHPNIVRAIEAGGEDDDLYLVQEYQHGANWQKRFNDFTLVEILELGIQLCEALHYMHELGIAHRDITPANLLISPVGKLKLTDFGMARRVFAPGITQSKMMLGTLNYMSPEQLLDATSVDGRTDVFAAGVILYRSLVGQLPFAAESPSDMAHRLLYAEPTDPLELNPDLPKSLAAKLLKCLAKDPDFRYLSSESLKKDLEEELKNSHLYLAQGKIEARNGSFKGAVQHFQHAVSLDDSLTDAWEQLGECLCQLDQQERASECFLRVINLDPSRANAFRRLGASYRAAGNHEASLKMFQRAWTLEPKDRDTCLSLCTAYREAGSVSDAIEHLNLLVQRHPEWDLPHLELGKILYQNGRVKEALSEFQAALSQAPLDTENLFNLASLYQEIKEEERAEELYRSLLSLEPNHPRAKQNLSCILYGRGELPEAEKLLGEVVMTEPTWVPPLFLLGLVQEGIGRTVDAIATYQRAMALAPEDTGIMLQLAGGLQKSFRSQAAIEVLEKAAAIEDENLPMVLYQLALGYRTSGNFERACELARSCQECAEDPELLRAAKALESQSISSRKKQVFRKGSR